MIKELYTDSLEFQDEGISRNLSKFRTSIQKVLPYRAGRAEPVSYKRTRQLGNIKRCEKFRQTEKDKTELISLICEI